MEQYKEMLDLVKSMEKDMDKYYNRNNKTAGIRIRKDLQKVRILAKKIRQEILIINLENNLRIKD